MSSRGERRNDDLAICRVAIVLAGHFSHARHLHRGDVGLLVPAGEGPGKRIAVGALQSHVGRAAEGGAKVRSRHSLAHVVGHKRRGAELKQHVDGAVIVFGLRQAGACSVLGPLVTDGGVRSEWEKKGEDGRKRGRCMSWRKTQKILTSKSWGSWRSQSPPEHLANIQSFYFRLLGQRQTG